MSSKIHQLDCGLYCTVYEGSDRPMMLSQYVGEIGPEGKKAEMSVGIPAMMVWHLSHEGKTVEINFCDAIKEAAAVLLSEEEVG